MNDARMVATYTDFSDVDQTAGNSRLSVAISTPASQSIIMYCAAMPVTSINGSRIIERRDIGLIVVITTPTGDTISSCG